jgi:hypothetical protein
LNISLLIQMDAIIEHTLPYLAADSLFNLALSSRTAYDMVGPQLTKVAQIERTKQAHSECMRLINTYRVDEVNSDECQRVMVLDPTLQCKINYYRANADNRWIMNDVHYTRWATTEDAKIRITAFDEVDAERNQELEDMEVPTRDVQKIVIITCGYAGGLTHAYWFTEMLADVRYVAAYYDERRNREQARGL